MRNESENLGEYLSIHQEKSFDQENRKKVKESLENPFSIIDYNPFLAVERHEDIKGDGFSMRFDYDVASQSGNQRYEKYWPRRNFFYLEDLCLFKTIDREKRKFIKRELKDLAPGCKIFFDPGKSYGSSAVVHEGLIYIGNDIASPAGILALGHEAGHVVAYQEGDRNERMQVLNLLKKIALKEEALTVEDQEIIVRGERDAWSFALQNLKGFIGTEKRPGGICSITEAKDFIHGISLASYYHKILADEISEVINQVIVE